MKQIYFLLAILSNTVLLSQTVLTSYPLNLGSKPESSMILTTKNDATNEVFVFAKTEKDFKILRYNSALFLTKQFISSTTYIENRTLMGYSFSEDGNPTLYWSTSDGNNIVIIKYYFENNTSKAIQFIFPASTHTIRAEYQSNNTFYILGESKSEAKFTLYVFKNGLVEQKELDFSPFIFQNNNMTRKSFRQLLVENPIEKMESNEYNSIYKANSKIKFYPEKNRIVLTLDHNIKNTQFFDIDLNTLEIKEKNFAQPLGKKKPKTSNSFFYNNKLYQINTNDEEFLFEIKDSESGQIVKNFEVTKNDSIHFKNSPIQIQKSNKGTKELKNTTKFLKELSTANAVVSVFSNDQNLYITLGGLLKQDYQQPFDEFFQEFLFIKVNETPNYYTTAVFFESIFDSNFNPTSLQQEPLATDKIYYFIDNNSKTRMHSILKFKDYFILGYYDLKTKLYTLRKFSDDNNESEFYQSVNR